MKLTKAAYGWPEDAQFLVPSEVLAHFADNLGKRGREGSSRMASEVCRVQEGLSRTSGRTGTIWQAKQRAGTRNSYLPNRC
ncbi:MAG: hypothetical protein U0894_16425 [Pirellulales bacterium]